MTPEEIHTHAVKAVSDIVALANKRGWRHNLNPEDWEEVLHVAWSSPASLSEENERNRAAIAYAESRATFLSEENERLREAHDHAWKTAKQAVRSFGVAGFSDAHGDAMVACIELFERQARAAIGEKQ